MQATLDDFQVLLLRRLYDECLRDESTAPDFRELMRDQASKLGGTWYGETYDDFTALGLLDPRASGEDFRAGAIRATLCEGSMVRRVDGQDGWCGLIR